MTKRFILCEGPDDMNALRAVGLIMGWAEPATTATGVGAGQERAMLLKAAAVTISVSVPSKNRGATGEGKSALARSLADNLAALPPRPDPNDESSVSLLSVVFDPDDEPASHFHVQLERAIREHAREWTLDEASSPGVWRAHRSAEEIDIRAVHWRAPGEELAGLPDHANLERLLCAVLAKAYPEDKKLVAGWLTQIRKRQQSVGRKLVGWKGAIHVWLATVYEKADDINAAARILHQQKECKLHVEPALIETGLLDDLRPLLAP